MASAAAYRLSGVVWKGEWPDNAVRPSREIGNAGFSDRKAELAQTKAVELGLGPPLASAASNGVLRDDQINWILANLRGGVSVSFDGQER